MCVRVYVCVVVTWWLCVRCVLAVRARTDGLIIAHLTPLAMNAPIVSMSPFTFMQDPEAWPQAIEKYKASIVVAPSFAYELLARRMAVSGNSYDLSSLMVADAAAEPVTKDTIAAMEATGFPEHCRCASYGLAEAVAWVSHTVSLDIDADTGLAVSGDVLESRMLGMHIVVADPDTLTALPCGETGRIYLRGPGVVPGYHGKPELTAQRFGVQLTGLSDCDAAVTTGMGWYDTQDIGVITTGNKLLVKGRASDMLIVMGRNIFPTDVEKLAEKHLGEQVRCASWWRCFLCASTTVWFAPGEHAKTVLAPAHVRVPCFAARPFTRSAEAAACASRLLAPPAHCSWRHVLASAQPQHS